MEDIVLGAITAITGGNLVMAIKSAFAAGRMVERLERAIKSLDAMRDKLAMVLERLSEVERKVNTCEEKLERHLRSS